MKLTKVAIGLMLLGTSLTPGQEGKKISPEQNKQQQQTKLKEKTQKNEEGKNKQKEKNTVNAKAKQDSVKQQRKISPDYCPPCGMG